MFWRSNVGKDSYIGRVGLFYLVSGVTERGARFGPRLLEHRHLGIGGRAFFATEGNAVAITETGV